jgi:hypothetical protein
MIMTYKRLPPPFLLPTPPQKEPSDKDKDGDSFEEFLDELGENKAEVLLMSCRRPSPPPSRWCARSATTLGPLRRSTRSSSSASWRSPSTRLPTQAALLHQEMVLAKALQR